MGLLIIDDEASYCGECGGGAFPRERSHATGTVYLARSGHACGVTWTRLGTHMKVTASVQFALREMRPDLEFVGNVPWRWVERPLDG